MQETLKKFIEPKNIPKKYGGELDFQFGQLPVLDPALEDVITWHGEYRDFPVGPLYWEDKGDHIQLVAVGSVNHKERYEVVCTVRKSVRNPVIDEKANGTLKGPEARPETLTVQTVEDFVLLAEKDTNLSLGHSHTSVADHTDTLKTETKIQNETNPVSHPQPASPATAAEDSERLFTVETDKTVTGTAAADSGTEASETSVEREASTLAGRPKNIAR
jgi:hypothetical protein